MPALRLIHGGLVMMSFFALVMGACGGGSTPTNGPGAAAPSTIAAGPDTPVAPAPIATLGTPSPAIRNPCALLSDADMAPLGSPTSHGSSARQPDADGVASSTCQWPVSATSLIELTVFDLSKAQSGATGFVSSALRNSAFNMRATVDDVAGVGDGAGVIVPPTPGPGNPAEFYAQKGVIAVRLGFTVSAGTSAPTADALTRVGTAAASAAFRVAGE